MQPTSTSRAFGTRLRAGLAGVVLALVLASCGADEPKTAGAPPAMRRLTEDQFRNTIADAFGADIKLGGKLEPLLRTGGLVALGARGASVTPFGAEKLHQLAKSVAEQVVDPEHRRTLVGCGPADPTTFEEACAAAFFTRVGRSLYRRPLTDDELKGRIAAAAMATTTFGDFHRGLSASLTAMLMGPHFLYLIETTEPDPRQAGGVRLDSYAKASRLSFFLWNAAPDNALLDAAARGELHTPSGLERQVDRMLTSVRVEDGLRGFYYDAYAFDKFQTLEKDAIIYPVFNLAIAEDAEEQLLRTLNDVLLVRGEDYRHLFTTRRSFMSANLARVYRIEAPNADGWAPYEFPEGDPRVGIQSQFAFTALHSHPGKSSPTLRGVAVRELLLCQKVPEPPADVDFTKFNDPQSPLKTARERLAMHTTAPACAGCHKLTDPLGLALEKFDGAGQYRTTEWGEPIDVGGDFDGLKFADADGFAKALSENPAATSCVVNRLFGYGVGRVPAREDQPALDFLQQKFAADGYRYKALLKRIATSAAFFAVTSAPAAVAAAAPPSEARGAK